MKGENMASSSLPSSTNTSPKLLMDSEPLDSVSDSFTFDSKIDELNIKLQESLEIRSGGLSGLPGEFPLSGSSTGRNRGGGGFDSRKIEFGMTHHYHPYPPITTSRSLSIAAPPGEDEEDGKMGIHFPSSPFPGKKRDWKIPRFLRRTQSASAEDDENGVPTTSSGTSSTTGVGHVSHSSIKPKDGSSGERGRSSSGSKASFDLFSFKDRERPRSSSELDKESSGSNKWRVKGMVVPNTVFENSDSDELSISRNNKGGRGGSEGELLDPLGLTLVTTIPKERHGSSDSGDSFISDDSSSTPTDTQPKKSFKLFFKRGTDMKFGLGFLKRRHTEGQISPPSVRPSPEEAKKWAESFQNLMISKYGQCLFKAFLQREFSNENIEFWIAVEQYRKARERKLPAKAQKIINEFVLSQSPREVNLDAVTKDVLINTTSFSQPDYNTFDQAQKKIQSILEADAYIRFLQSDLYLELVHPERYGPSGGCESPISETMVTTSTKDSSGGNHIPTTRASNIGAVLSRKGLLTQQSDSTE